MAPIIQTIILVCGPFFGLWLGNLLNRSKEIQQWRRDRILEVYTDVIRACEIVTDEATKLYLDISDPTTQRLILSEKISELHRAAQRAALLAPTEMIATLNALVAHVDIKTAKRAGSFPKLSLDEWKKVTITDLAVIVAQFTNEVRNDLTAHSPSRIIDQWRQILRRSK